MALHLPKTRREIFCWSMVFFLLGVGIHSVFPVTKIEMGWWTTAASLLVVAWSFGRGSSRGTWSVWLILGCALVGGLLRFDISIPSAASGVMPYFGELSTSQGRVDSVSAMSKGSRLIVSASSIDGRELTSPGTHIEVSLFTRSLPSVGSLVSVSCRLQLLETNGDSTFWQFLAKQDVWSQCRGATRVSILSLPSPFDVSARLQQWRTVVTQRIATLYPHDEATLLSGIMYGDQDLSQEQKDLMRRAGLMHLVAVSGSNVTIVVSLLQAVILAIGWNRRRSFWVVTVGIVLFIGFVGASASVVRAGIMGWLVLLARQTGRRSSASHILLVTATIVALLNPWLLAFDAGFDLSFLATWGLIIWTPLIAARATWLTHRFGLREAFATTSGATLMTAPYLAWSFSQTSLAGLLTNLLALPLVPFIMLWGFFSALWAKGPGSSIVTVPTFGFLRLLEWIAHLSDYLPFLNLQFAAMNVLWLFGTYGFLLYLWWRLRAKCSLSTENGAFRGVNVKHSRDTKSVVNYSQ